MQKHRGEIVDLHGHVLGHHDGIEFYTIGQRKGLGITTPKPVYVMELDVENNRVVVGDESALDRDEFTASELQLASVRQSGRADRGDGENPLQPSRHAGDGDAAGGRAGEGEIASRRSAPSRPARRRCFIRMIWWWAAGGLRVNEAWRRLEISS